MVLSHQYDHRLNMSCFSAARLIKYVNRSSFSQLFQKMKIRSDQKKRRNGRRIYIQDTTSSAKQSPQERKIEVILERTLRSPLLTNQKKKQLLFKQRTWVSPHRASSFWYVRVHTNPTHCLLRMYIETSCTKWCRAATRKHTYRKALFSMQDVRVSRR